MAIRSPYDFKNACFARRLRFCILEVKMGAKKKEPTQAVVMSSTKRFGKRQVVGLGLVVILIVLAAGLVAFLTLGKDKTGDSSDKPKTTAEAIEASDNLKYSEKYDEAANMTAEAYENSDNNDQKYNLAQQTAAVYESNQEYDKAIEWYLKADEIKPGKRGPLAALGRCYKGKGDKGKAIEYFKKAIAAVDADPSGEGAQNDKAYYQYEIDELTKGQ